MTKTKLLRIIHDAFEDVPRPAKFTCEDGDLECMNKDRTLHSLQKGAVTLEQVNHPGYSIYTEILPAGTAWFFEDFARLSLIRPANRLEWLGAQFVRTLDERLSRICTRPQHCAVLLFLDFLAENRAKLVEFHFGNHFKTIRRRWNAAGPA